MNEKYAHFWKNYVIAVPAIALAIVTAPLLAPTHTVGATTLLFAAVMISSWFGGLGPGILASLLAAVAVDYVVIPPAFEWTIGRDAFFQVALFALVALFTSFLNEARRYLEREERCRTQRVAQRWLDERRQKGESLRGLANELALSANSIADAVRLLDEDPRDGSRVATARAIIDRHMDQMDRIISRVVKANTIPLGDESTAIAETQSMCIPRHSDVQL